MRQILKVRLAGLPNILWLLIMLYTTQAVPSVNASTVCATQWSIYRGKKWTAYQEPKTCIYCKFVAVYYGKNTFALATDCARFTKKSKKLCNKNVFTPWVRWSAIMEIVS